MAAESSEGEEEGKLSGGNQVLVIDEDLRELGKKAAWSVSSCKTGNGVSSLRDDNLETYWQLLTHLFIHFFSQFRCSNSFNLFLFLFLFVFRSDGAQPHFVNIQFQKKVRLQVINYYMLLPISFFYILIMFFFNWEFGLLY